MVTVVQQVLSKNEICVLLNVFVETQLGMKWNTKISK